MTGSSILRATITWLRDTWDEVDDAQPNGRSASENPVAANPAGSSEREQPERMCALRAREPEHGLG